MKTQMIIGLVSATAMGVLSTQAEDAIGWVSPLTSTTYSWSEPANWTNGVANGIFGPNLAGSGKTFPTICLNEDVTLAMGLVFAYTNSEQYLTLRGEGADCTITLGGDILVSMTGGTKGGVTLGSATANNNLNVNLNGNRSFVIDALELKTLGSVLGGNLKVTGNASVSKNFVLSGQTGVIDENVNAVFTTGRGLYIYEKSQFLSGCKRAGDVRLESGFLVYEGTEKGSATADSIGRLTLAPGNLGGGLVRFQNYGSSGYFNAHLTIDEIVREQETMMDFHSANNILGAGAVGADGVVNVTVTKGVTAIGSGEAGTPQVPVVPWARGSTSNSQTTDQYFTHLVSYDADRGFRLLDPTNEFVTYTEDYEGSVEEENANVRVTAGNVVFSGSNTVNSLSTLAGGPLTITATDGMKILSGVLDLSVWNNVTVNGNFDFGDRTAYITQCGNKSATLKGTIKGRDVVFGDQLMRAVYSGAPLALQATSDITGDVYVNGSVSVANNSFFPHGDGKNGHTYVNGMFRIFTTQITLNGVSGSGRFVYGQSYATNLTIGDNDANGDFGGSIERTGGTMSLTKTGTGSQRFGGDITINSELKVLGGTVIFDGAVKASSVAIADGVTIGGCGTFASAVTLQGTTKLATSVADRKLSCLTFEAGLSAGGVITVDVDTEDWKGEHCIVKVGAGTLENVVFKKGANIGRMRMSEDKTELLAIKSSGLVVVVR